MSGRTLLEVDEKKPLGFFPKLYERVVTTMGKENLDKMEALKDDAEDLIRFTHGLDNYRNALQVKESYGEKNPYECKVKREYGNKAYSEGKDLDALYFYTQAVLAAPCDPDTGLGKELAVALANRSAALFSLKAYNLALDDIRLALESGYPKELKYKLLERKAKILTFYRQFGDAKDTWKAFVSALDDSNVDKDKKIKMQRDAQQMLAFFEKSQSVYNDPKVIINPKPELQKVNEKNPMYPAISSSISFKYEAGRGRYAVANRDVVVGEFVCVERPIVSRILPEYAESNCNNCFKCMKAPLPCPVCARATFCSYKCRQIALSTYHRYECKVMDLLVATGMSIICFLAYRAVTQKSVEFFRANMDKFANHDETSGNTKEQKEKYLSDDYRNLYNLVTHHSERKFGDIFHRAMFSVLMLRCLKRLGYFGPDRVDDTVADLSDDEAMVGAVLNHFLESLQFNSHEVAQFEMLSRDKEEGAQSVFIGAAVYPTLALFNHSCDPSIVRFYVEDVVCVQAIKNIAKGEEICENYGPIFFHSDRKDRQDRLKKQYWFDCRCRPCVEDWPLMHEMAADSLTFRCADCRGAVPFAASSAANNPLIRCSCGTPVPMLQALKAISETDLINERAKAAMAEGKLEQAQALYCDYLSTLDQYLVPPYQDYYKIQQSIWKCIWMRFGNRVIKGKAKRPKAVTDDFDTVD